MKLQLKLGCPGSECIDDSGIDDYLISLQSEIPFLQDRIVAPKNESEMAFHLCILKNTVNLERKYPLSGEKILDLAKNFPQILPDLQAISRENPDTLCFFRIYKFLLTEKNILEIEKKSLNSALESALEILTSNMNFQTGSFLKTMVQEELEKKITDLNKRIDAKILAQEEKIFAKTKLRLTYPWPRLIEPESLDSLRNVSEIRIEFRGNEILAFVHPDKDICDLQKEKISLEEKLQSFTTQKILQITPLLKPLIQQIESSFLQRREQVWILHLLQKCKTLQLCFPEFFDQNRIEINSARLPALEKNTIETKPLNLVLYPGATMICGTNMSGKTTVLRTVHLSLFLCACALPVPAKSIRVCKNLLPFLHLKNSGNLKDGLSAFASEVNFLQTHLQKNCILVDELFQTTDPLSGVTLAKAFIHLFQKKQIFFIFTSHYPQLLEENIDFLSMDLPNLDQIYTLLDLKKKLPYTLSRGKPDDFLHALKIFSIICKEQEILDKIQNLQKDV